MTRTDLHPLRVAVTGGTSGLGAALVAELLGRHAHVAFVARHRDAVDATLQRVARRSSPVRAHGIVGDIARKEDIHPIALQIVAALGGLDVLVNNASSLGPVPLALLADTECEELELALATNLVGPFRLTKALLGPLAASARDGGHPLVVNISSDAAVTPYPTWGAYGASKAALLHLTRIWDAELAADGVRSSHHRTIGAKTDRNRIRDLARGRFRTFERGWIGVGHRQRVQRRVHVARIQRQEVDAL